MLHDEFMNYAGYAVSYEDYKNIIEPMWMDYPGTSKEDFCSYPYFRKFRKETEQEIRSEVKLLVMTNRLDGDEIADLQNRYGKVGPGELGEGFGYWFWVDRSHNGHRTKVAFYRGQDLVPFDVFEWEN